MWFPLKHNHCMHAFTCNYVAEFSMYMYIYVCMSHPACILKCSLGVIAVTFMSKSSDSFFFVHYKRVKLNKVLSLDCSQHFFGHTLLLIYNAHTHKQTNKHKKHIIL